MRSIISLMRRSWSDFENWALSQKTRPHGFKQLGHKPCCAVTLDGYRFRKYIEELYYLCRKNIGANQLCGYHEADLRLCFCICKKQIFL